MPDTPSPEDEFADLFRKLPSARPAETPAPSPASGPEGAASVEPGSRRALREAAARSQAPAPQAASPAQAPAPHTSAPHTPLHEPVASPRATATLDALFVSEDDAHETARAAREHRDRRKSRVATWVGFGITLALIGGIVTGGFYVWNTYEDKIRAFMGWEEPKDYEEGLAEGEVLITIVSGDTGASISEILYEAGVTKTPDAFYDYLIDTAQNPDFVPGVFALQAKMTSAAALAAILDPASKRENSARLREGLTVDQTLPLLAEGIGIPFDDFVAAVSDPSVYGVSAASLEGWLFPATYTFDPGATATDVIQTLVDRTVRSLDDAGVPVEQRQEILTIASIIQREARFEADFYKVSRVIQNRLDPNNDETFGKLQMDSTAQYGYKEMHDGTVSTSQAALEDDNLWNTYVHPGLPVGPIANPGDLAIDAAMHPADGAWLYFVTVNLETGETIFTDTYADHLTAVEQWQEWCRANDSDDC